MLRSKVAKSHFPNGKVCGRELRGRARDVADSQGFYLFAPRIYKFRTYYAREIEPASTKVSRMRHMRGWSRSTRGLLSKRHGGVRKTGSRG